MSPEDGRAKNCLCEASVRERCQPFRSFSRQKNKALDEYRNVREPSGSSGPTYGLSTFRCGMDGWDKTFAMLKGRSVHEQHAHINWYDRRLLPSLEN